MKKKKFKILNYVAVAFAFLFSFFLLGSNNKVSAADSLGGTFYIAKEDGTAVSETIAGNYLYYYYVKGSTNNCTSYTTTVMEYGKITDSVFNKTFGQYYYECEEISFLVVTTSSHADTEFNHTQVTNKFVGDSIYFWNGFRDLYKIVNWYMDNDGYEGAFILGNTSASEVATNLKIVRMFEDLKAPVIDGYEGVYYSNYDSETSLSSIISKITAIDETDGAVELNVVEDNYSNSMKTLGSHLVTLSASDSANNTTTITIDIRVVDVTKPVITGQNEYISNMSNPITEASIRNGLAATDNYDKSGLVINLIEDNFSDNKDKAGSYTIKYNVTDSSTNVSNDYIVTITNHDDIKPVIDGTATYNVSSTGIITSDYILSQLAATDNIDTNLTPVLVEDNYTELSTKVGTYTMTFNVTDSSGNVSDTFTATIVVYDDIPPVIWVSNDFFAVEDTIALTHEQIVSAILAMNGIDKTEVVAYKFNENNYTNNSNIAGTYSVALSLQMNDGTVVELSSNIEVVGEEVIVPVPEADDDKKFLEEVKDFFVNIWNTIKEFFVKLWNSIVKYIAFGWLWDDENKFDVNWKEWN